jgi:hypothetical protein
MISLKVTSGRLKAPIDVGSSVRQALAVLVSPAPSPQLSLRHISFSLATGARVKSIWRSSRPHQKLRPRLSPSTSRLNPPEPCVTVGAPEDQLSHQNIVF